MESSLSSPLPTGGLFPDSDVQIFPSGLRLSQPKRFEDLALLNTEYLELVARTIEIGRRLRKTHFTELRSEGPKAEWRYDLPIIYYGRATNGPPVADSKGGVEGVVPIIIFQNNMCPDTALGLCAPCGYSSIPPGKADPVRQMRWVLQNFETLVARRQDGVAHDYQLLGREERSRAYTLQLAGIGSFMQDSEVSPLQRLTMLRMCREFGRANDIVLNISLECKARDVLKAEESGEWEQWVGEGLILELNLEVTFGLESIQTIPRQLIYCKGLPPSTIAGMLRVVKRRGLDCGAYVYSGFHSMSFSEIHASVKTTLDFLEEAGCYCVLMLPNVQPLTLPHLLYESGRYRLPSPVEAVRLVETLRGRSRSRASNPKYQHFWHIGPLGAQPWPEATLYDDKMNSACASCRSKVTKAIDRMAITHDWSQFAEETALLWECRCAPLDDSELPGDLVDRVNQNLWFASKNIDSFVRSVVGSTGKYLRLFDATT